tara:strand:- start:1916 stop:2812 length:897 start_codon:yes stop_codon:yes gene_type:complete
MQKTDLNPNVQRRLEFIEFSLFWEREVGRSAITKQFDISPQQATIDLNTYLDFAPGNMFYDPRRRRYVPLETFEQCFIQGNAKEYLRFLESYARGYRNADEVWIANLPKFKAAYMDGRDVSPKILRTVLTGIRTKRSFQMTYISLSSGEVASRKVSPHALATDGNRWHMRAYDHDNSRFSDFVLSRIKTASRLNESDVTSDGDEEWNTLITLRLQPDPSLSEAMQRGIAKEYQMKNQVLTMKVCQAMLFYYLRNLGFNPRPASNKKMRNESSYYLALVDAEKIEDWLRRRGKTSRDAR